MAQTESEHPDGQPSGAQQAIVERQEHASIQDAIKFAEERYDALNWAANQEGPHKELFEKMALEVEALKSFASSKIEPQDESEEE